jgi:hypothetical protein
MFKVPASIATPNSRVGGAMSREAFDALLPSERLFHIRTGGTVTPAAASAPAAHTPVGPGQLARSVFETLSPAARHEAITVRRLTIVG